MVKEEQAKVNLFGFKCAGRGIIWGGGERPGRTEVKARRKMQRVKLRLQER